MRVLLISPSLSHGGAERVASVWANGFVQEGHEIVFVTNLYDTITYKLDDRIKTLPLFTGKRNKFLKYLIAVKNIRSYIKDYKPDVIIGVMFVPALLGRIAALCLHVPVIMTEHNSFERPKCAPMSLADRFAKFYLNYLYDYITVLTEADYKIIGKRYKNVSVLPNPLALEPLSKLPHKENIVLAAGRLDAWHYKGFDLLISAWAKVVSSFKSQESRFKFQKFQDSKELEPGTTETCNLKPAEDLKESSAWRLQIAGTGSEESLKYLKQLCKEKGVEGSVEFVGFVSDMQSLYQKASVFVLSSRYEAFGMVLIEAMSQGCACVACDFKGRQSEIIRDSSEGVTCEIENIDSLADAMSAVMYNKEYQLIVQRNAIERSKSFLPGTIIKKWNSILTTVVK